LYPSPLPDIFKGEQLVLAGRYSGHGNSTITLEGLVNGATKKHTFEVTFPEESSGHEFIPRLWATRRVGYLLDEIRLHGENTETRDEVTQLARKYGIVTPYTAYLIVEDEDHRSVASGLRSFQAFEKDARVRQEAKKSWDSFNMVQSGERAIAGDRLNESLKSATVLAPAAGGLDGGGRAMYDSSRGSLGLAVPGTPEANTPAQAAREQLVRYSQQSRFVGGRNFFQNGAQWIDGEVQNSPSARHVRLQFSSPEYFAFAAKNKQALPWLALGQNLQFVLDGVVYEIYE
jgi:Ca-activated chloride channel family protein